MTAFPGLKLCHSVVGLGCPLLPQPVRGVHAPLLWVFLEHRAPLCHLFGEDKNALQGREKVF